MKEKKEEEYEEEDDHYELLTTATGIQRLTRVFGCTKNGHLVAEVIIKKLRTRVLITREVANIIYTPDCQWCVDRCIEVPQALLLPSHLYKSKKLKERMTVPRLTTAFVVLWSGMPQEQEFITVFSREQWRQWRLNEGYSNRPERGPERIRERSRVEKPKRLITSEKPTTDQDLSDILGEPVTPKRARLIIREQRRL